MSRVVLYEEQIEGQKLKPPLLVKINNRIYSRSRYLGEIEKS